MHRLTLVVLAVLCTFSFAHGQEIVNWPSWRGSDASGSISKGQFPAKFGPEEYRWRAELPGKGTSTPIVFNQQIFLTAPTEGNDSVLAFDALGKQLWKTVFDKEEKGKHPNASGSNSSPVTDGKSLYVYFKSGLFAALDLSGNVLWKQSIVEQFGKENMFWDYGASPVVTQKYVVLVRMHAGDSWIAAFNKADGKLAWKVDRTYQVPTEVDQCYTTPLVIEFGGKESLLTWGAEHITIHNTEDGKKVWTCGNFNPEGNRLWPAIATPVIVGDHVVVAFGRADRDQPLLYGIRLTGEDDVTQSNHAWKRNNVGTFVPSPAVFEGRVLVLGDQGEVELLDAASGQSAWKDKLPKHRKKFYASPLVAGGRLYAIREDGVVFVANVSLEQFKLEAENDMQEPIIGSPIPFGNGILLRGEKHLFCVGQ